MLDKLKAIKERWQEVSLMLSDPELMSDMNRYTKLNKEYKDLEKIVVKYDEYRDVLSNIKANKEIIDKEKDEEFRQMAKGDLDQLNEKKEALIDEIEYMLLPKDPEDEKDVVLEIRAGTGGDEASIFAGDLFKLYSKFIERKGWQLEVISLTLGTSGGYKEIISNVKGENVYGILKFESGVHRVQRVPETETQGRVHTSAATVAVLPEADEVDIKINTADIRRDTFRSSGAGGQHVNKVESAIRLTHIPSGVVVECQEGRSQLKNYEMAMQVLRTRLYEESLRKKQQELADKRKTLVSTGDRSAKIRTYNYPQGRFTDHRINMTTYNLAEIMNGEIDEVIDQLRIAENTEKMKTGS
ncbi:MAG: peptide chain release factor 1 [Chitinophagaceae bacterium]|nr:MAG: peptide chain release factor 1 [Chitinophagaceae bacterium]